MSVWLQALTSTLLSVNVRPKSLGLPVKRLSYFHWRFPAHRIKHASLATHGGSQLIADWGTVCSLAKKSGPQLGSRVNPPSLCTRHVTIPDHPFAEKRFCTKKQKNGMAHHEEPPFVVSLRVSPVRVERSRIVPLSPLQTIARVRPSGDKLLLHDGSICAGSVCLPVCTSNRKVWLVSPVILLYKQTAQGNCKSPQTGCSPQWAFAAFPETCVPARLK